MAAMTQITAPAGPATNGPANINEPDGSPWFVEGVAYSTSDRWIAYFQGKGATTTAGEAPASYTATVTAQREEARRTGVRNRYMRDATDPDAPTYYATGA